MGSSRPVSQLNILVGPKEVGQEDRSSEQIHDTVPDDLTSRADDIATIGEGPDEEINDPDEGEDKSGA